jgi:hypothetical protein
MAVRYNNNPSKLNTPEAVSFKGLLGCFVNFDLENVVFTSPSLSQGMSGFLILYNLDKTYWFHDFTPLDRQDTHLSIIMFWKRHTEFDIIHHLQKTLIVRTGRYVDCGMFASKRHPGILLENGAEILNYTLLLSRF